MESKTTWDILNSSEKPLHQTIKLFKTMTVTIPATPLTGQELLDTIKALGDVSKLELAKACGYAIETEDGTIKTDFTAFYEAILTAKGVDLQLQRDNSPETQAKEMRMKIWESTLR